VYRRYASLFFVTGIGQSDNELVTLEIIHRYVEVLDRYFGNVRNLSRCSPFSFDKVARSASSICEFFVRGECFGSDICTQNLQLPESLRRESAVCTRVSVAFN
jgi:hypothetical protein